MKYENCYLGVKVKHPLGFEGIIAGFFETPEHIEWRLEKKKGNEPAYCEKVSLGTVAFGKYEEYMVFIELLEAV